ncbi:expansin EXLX1 family cellulose-binding protein [Streptomyces sp. S.PB5]|uniref:expansin EXLX1 family cellulose-binding protein n=1 Tax=Streptomyces sp. S.PB5 TaxID=3020844 RepID=UPI0025AF206E|nr:expansin EXLX1 family cellulose-binding protein [Streptomyces sp. S.PB5]MDN3028046.1 expansin EXLX1 family cellulose-binding protein [Streptomyces sp. S.PB5]
MTTRQAARQRRARRRLMLGTTVAVAAAGVLAYLSTALLPGHKVDAGPAAATPLVTSQPKAADTAGTASPSATPSATPSPSSSPSSSPSASGSASPKATASAKATKSSSEGTQKTSRGSTTPPSAGRIRPNTSYKGVATAYEAGVGDGACLFGPSPDMMIAAMNTTDYETSRACGAYVLVRAANGKSITVRITNECPLPCAPGQIDLSQQAFAKLADLKVGRLSITWSLVSPSSIGTMSIRYKTGSSAYWCGIQAIGHRNPVARLEVSTGSGWRSLPRTSYNYFISDNGSGCGKAIRVTDIYGEQLTISGLAVLPNVVQPTRVQFSRH